MSSPKYIYDQKNLTLETQDGTLFIDNNCEIAKFYSIDQVKRHLQESNLLGTIGLRLDMKINNSI